MELFAVIGVLNHLKVKKAAFVGWSDGAICGRSQPLLLYFVPCLTRIHLALDLANRYPDRVDRAFAFAANYNIRYAYIYHSLNAILKLFFLSGVMYISVSPVFTTYIDRAGEHIPPSCNSRQPKACHRS